MKKSINYCPAVLISAVAAARAGAGVLFTDSSYASGGAEMATGSTYLTAEFTTDTSTYNAISAVLNLQAGNGSSTGLLSLWSDGGDQPGSLVANFSSPSGYNTSAVAPATFSLGGYNLAAATNYWIVLNAPTGAINWAWVNSSSVQQAWGESSDAGLTWFTDDAFPLQYSINTSTGSTAVTSAAWNLSTGGSWNSSASWTQGIPNSAGATATFGVKLTTSADVTLDVTETVGHVVFNNSSASYTLTTGTGGLLAINNSSTTATGVPDITVLAGTHAISAAVNLSAGVTIVAGSGTVLTISGIVAGVGPLTKTGAGLVKLAGVNIYTGGTAVSAGTLEIAPTGSLLSTAAVNVSGGAVYFDASTSTSLQIKTIGATTIGNNSSITLATSATQSDRTLLRTGGLTIGSTASVLQLGNGDLDVAGGDLTALTAAVKAGFNSGSWNGSDGVLSSTAAADSSHLLALGMIRNNQSGTALFGSGNLFDTVAPAPSDVLAKLTYFGDANLDGRIDGSDYTLIDNGFLAGTTGWYAGDFNYDGTVDGSDFTLIDNAFNLQTMSLTPSTVVAAPTALVTATVVPEPTTATLLAAAVLGRRRRR